MFEADEGFDGASLMLNMHKSKTFDFVMKLLMRSCTVDFGDMLNCEYHLGDKDQEEWCSFCKIRHAGRKQLHKNIRRK